MNLLINVLYSLRTFFLSSRQWYTPFIATNLLSYPLNSNNIDDEYLASLFFLNYNLEEYNLFVN